MTLERHIDVFLAFNLYLRGEVFYITHLARFDITLICRKMIHYNVMVNRIVSLFENDAISYLKSVRAKLSIFEIHL